METNEQIEEAMFTFRYKDRAYLIPYPLKEILEELQHTAIHAYVYPTLQWVAQQQQSSDPSPILELVTDESKPIDGICGVQNFLARLDAKHSGNEGMKTLRTDRAYFCRDVSRERLIAFEHMLGVDSEGIDAGDERPLLGVDIRLVNATRWYLEELCRQRYVQERIEWQRRCLARNMHSDH